MQWISSSGNGFFPVKNWLILNDKHFKFLIIWENILQEEEYFELILIWTNWNNISELSIQWKTYHIKKKTLAVFVRIQISNVTELSKLLGNKKSYFVMRWRCHRSSFASHMPVIEISKIYTPINGIVKEKV